MVKTKLFFLPHAGGSARGYMVMKRYLDTSIIEPVPLEMAGRGCRIQESCFTDMESCVEDLYETMKSELSDCPYAVFGHSLGSVVSYELIRYIDRMGMKPPVCAFFSGRSAPGYEFPGPVLSGLNDTEFIEKFNQFQGLPPEILANQNILELVLPVLRADVQLAENYHPDEISKLPCDVYAFYGEKDVLVCKEGMEAWKSVTEQSTGVTSFDGGHFYFKENTESLAKRISSILRELAAKEEKAYGKNF